MRGTGFVVLVTLLSAMASAQLRVPELAVSPQIDGVLDEKVWSQALVVELPFEVDPGDSVASKVHTEALLFSTPSTLYVGFRAFDPNPREIRAHLADRDQLYRDDFVGIILDTFADHRKAYQFHVNPLGVQGDSLRLASGEGEWEDGSWDAIWSAAGKITAEGYTVEMAIPFAALRFPSGIGEKQFGFAVFRVYPRSLRRLLFSVPLDRNNACMLCQLPHLVGFASAKPGRSLELVPTWVAAREQERKDFNTERLNQPSTQGQAGLSLLWGLTPNLTLAATVNPDFSQVEADSKQLAVNRVFSLFFPEKRPFFLEGADAFATPLRAVYTRTTVDPDWGLKLVGKQGPSTLGLLVARDQLTPLVLPGPEASKNVSLLQPSTVSAGRWRYDVTTNSSLGVLFTDRRGGGFTSTLAGFDAFFRLSKADTLSGQWLRSSTHYPQTPELGTSANTKASGSAWVASYTHGSRNFEAWAEARNLQNGFRADVGFIPQVGVRGAEVGAQRVFWGEDGDWYTVLRVGGEVERWEDQEGRLLAESQRTSLRYQGPLQSTVLLSLSHFRKSWHQHLFSGFSGRLFSNIRFTGDVTASCGLEWGDAIDYQGSRPARRWAVKPGFTWNIGRRLYLQGDFLAENLTVPEGNLYRASIAEIRLVSYFGVRSFLRLITQHSLLRTWPEHYLEPSDRVSRQWTHQLLFAYKLNPQTLLFLGASAGEAGDSQRWARTLQRSVFMKFSYNWQV